MKIYTIEYLFENGNPVTRYFEEEEMRDYIFEYDKKHGKQLLIRKRDYKEIREDQSKKTAEDILKFAEEFFEYDEEGFIEELKKFINKIGAFYPRYDHSYFLNLMKELEVDANKKFNTMSYGQKKKSLLACALSLRTDYLLLDEPTNGLDIPSKALFRKVILQHSVSTDLTDLHGTTIIISTHQVKDVENLIDPIVILDHDEVLLNATFEEITEKLYFDYGSEKSDDALYTEMIPGGYINVLPNKLGMESNVNVEALFNAVRNNKKKIREIFCFGQ